MNIPNEKELNIFQKYFKECVLLSVVAAVIYLFLMTNDLNRYIRDTMTNDKVILIKTIEQNTNVINEFNQQTKKEANK